jgi:nitrite reductase/ring-hydroxylating ferredoxin subunit
MTESDVVRPEGEHAGAPVVTRRAMLLGAGAVGAAGVLAACGSAETPTTTPTTASPSNARPSNASPPSASPSNAGPPATAGGVGAAGATAISTADIPVGGGKIFGDGKIVVTQPTAGTFKAFDATCTHQQCTVGEVSNGKITCPCHLSQFNIADGSVARGPATRALGAKNATVANGSINIT